MTKKEFNDLFQAKYDEVLAETAKNVHNSLKALSDSGEKLDIDNATAIAVIESFNMSSSLIKKLFEDVLQFSD